ncbi:hypothetical protein [Porphyrobacter sp. GA68]|uniref:hypothetical protein n=1 Tax=Porphyrobacter sp. GA68 TaxID=2883480 RepID=UPI001D18F1BB|nr:hypothetical protein [Porphyrobacter sp. GA68]
MNTSVVYFLGFVLVVAGLGYGAMSLGVPMLWIGIGAVILLGIGLMSTVTHTRRPGPSGEEQITRTTTTIREE